MDAVDERRAAAVWWRIQAVADEEGAPVQVRHACIACARSVDAFGAGLSMALGDGLCEPVFATDPRVRELEDLQFTLGQGPRSDALEQGRPVLIHDLSNADAASRWPQFAPEAVRCGVRAMVSVPIQAGAIRLGVLDCYREQTGLPGADTLAEVLICADAVLVLSLDGDGVSRSLTELLDTGFTAHRAQVHQAVGMMSVQLGVGITNALVRLRAHAYTHDRPLAAVATDVVARRLRFSPDQVADDPPTPNGAGRKDP